MKDPSKMSERELRLEVGNLRGRLAAAHEIRKVAYDDGIRIGYDRGFPAGVQHERTRVLREIDKMRDG